MITVKRFSDEVYQAMFEDDEMWCFAPETMNGTIYYDLPVLDV